MPSYFNNPQRDIDWTPKHDRQMVDGWMDRQADNKAETMWGYIITLQENEPVLFRR